MHGLAWCGVLGPTHRPTDVGQELAATTLGAELAAGLHHEHSAQVGSFSSSVWHAAIVHLSYVPRLSVHHPVGVRESQRGGQPRPVRSGKVDSPSLPPVEYQYGPEPGEPAHVRSAESACVRFAESSVSLL